jgi:transcription-repair coupling factor (superfamily II helicase)
VHVFDVIRDDDRLEAIGRLLGDRRGAVIAEGLWGSCAPILAAIVAETLGRPLLLVTAHSDEADDFRDDIESTTGRTPELFPALEALPGEQQADDELVAERLRLCLWLTERQAEERSRDREIERSRQDARTRGQSRIQNPKSKIDSPSIIVAPIQALMQPVPTPAAIAEQSRLIRVGATISIDELTAWLDVSGFVRCEQVETPGDFALRGGIVDVFSHAQVEPVRIELFGDEVESIRLFEASTQRSSTSLESVRIPAMRFNADPRAITGLTAYLPADTIIAFNEPLEIQELGRTYWHDAGGRHLSAGERLLAVAPAALPRRRRRADDRAGRAQPAAV